MTETEERFHNLCMSVMRTQDHISKVLEASYNHTTTTQDFQDSLIKISEQLTDALCERREVA